MISGDWHNCAHMFLHDSFSHFSSSIGKMTNTVATQTEAQSEAKQNWIQIHTILYSRADFEMPKRKEKNRKNAASMKL